jgi:hypothetical protein
MNLAAIRKEARFRLKDESKPYFWKDEWLDARINEAEQEACIRARLIEDNSSVASSIDVTTDALRYELHPSVIDVLAAEYASNPGVPVTVWTLTETELVFSEPPKAADVLLMTVIRMPLDEMSSDTDTPEIRSHHHIRLIDWIEHRAYAVKDADAFAPGESEKALERFEQSFGRRPDANVQRKHREKTGRVVRMNAF